MRQHAQIEMTGPLVAHGARTAEEYRAKQAAHLRQLRSGYPLSGFGEPHAVSEPIPAIVSGGRWVVMCPCGNAPSASPEWALACCFECGAVYEAVTFPADREAVEAALGRLPVGQPRHWAPKDPDDATEEGQT